MPLNKEMPACILKKAAWSYKISIMAGEASTKTGHGRRENGAFGAGWTGDGLV